MNSIKEKKSYGVKYNRSNDNYDYSYNRENDNYRRDARTEERFANNRRSTGYENYENSNSYDRYRQQASTREQNDSRGYKENSQNDRDYINNPNNYRQNDDYSNNQSYARENFSEKVYYDNATMEERGFSRNNNQVYESGFTAYSNYNKKGRQDKKKLNTRAKVLICVFFAIIALFTTLISVNAIPSANAQTEKVSSPEVIIQEEALTKGESSSGTGNIDLVPLAPKYEYDQSTNWFDRLCDWIENLVG